MYGPLCKHAVSHVACTTRVVPIVAARGARRPRRRAGRPSEFTYLGMPRKKTVLGRRTANEDRGRWRRITPFVLGAGLATEAGIPRHVGPSHLTVKWHELFPPLLLFFHVIAVTSTLRVRSSRLYDATAGSRALDRCLRVMRDEPTAT